MNEEKQQQEREAGDETSRKRKRKRKRPHSANMTFIVGWYVYTNFWKNTSVPFICHTDLEEKKDYLEDLGYIGMICTIIGKDWPTSPLRQLFPHSSLTKPHQTL